MQVGPLCGNDQAEELILQAVSGDGSVDQADLDCHLSGADRHVSTRSMRTSAIVAVHGQPSVIPSIHRHSAVQTDGLQALADAE